MDCTFDYDTFDAVAFDVCEPEPAIDTSMLAARLQMTRRLLDDEEILIL